MEKQLLATDEFQMIFSDFLDQTSDALQQLNQQLKAESDLRRKSELEAEQRRNRIKEILNSITDSFFIIDKDWNIQYVNNTISIQLYDNNPGMGKNEDFIGRNYWQIVPMYLGTMAEENLRATMEKKEIRRWEIENTDMGRWQECFAYPSEAGISILTVDITERKQLQEVLTFQAHVLSNVHDAIIVLDANHSITFWNNIAESMFGWTAGEAIGKSVDELLQIVIPGSIREKEISCLYRNESYNGEVIYHHKDGREICISLHGNVVKDRQGKMKEIVISLRDITMQKKLEMEIKNQHTMMLLAEKEKNEALKKAISMKDEFLSLISHEFKTPLTVINSAIQAMRLICKNELSDKANEFLNKILQNSDRQLKLVNNLLDITRINAGHIKIYKTNLDIVYLTRTITESIRIYAEQKGIRLLFSSTLQKKEIAIDEEKYERILLNLLSNAVKFTPRGKRIWIRVAQKNINGKCKVCVQVKDQGIGIPQDKQKLIFEKFGQVDSSLSRQAEGSGIGLSLVKMLVELLDGEITLESMEGNGSAFTVMFPVRKINETPIEKMLQEISDSRLIKATAIEFSDVY